MATYTADELAEILDAIDDDRARMSEADYFDEVDAMAESFGAS